MSGTSDEATDATQTPESGPPDRISQCEAGHDDESQAFADLFDCAEDVTADAFAAAVAEYRAGRPEVVTTSWLCTVAKRRLIDHWRREHVASKNVIPLSGRGLVFESPQIGERDAVVRALGALAPEQRAALVLQHVEGFSVAEIAHIISRTPKATESLLGRARSAFRAAYSEVDHD